MFMLCSKEEIGDLSHMGRKQWWSSG